jgi:hypothetical protein
LFSLLDSHRVIIPGKFLEPTNSPLGPLMLREALFVRSTRVIAFTP